MENNHQQSIIAQRVDILYQNSIVSVPANLFCSLIIFTGLYEVVDTHALNIWLAAVVVITLFRIGIYFFKKHTTLTSSFYISLFLIGTTLSALLWAVAGTVLMPHGALLQQTVIILIILGIAAGGMQSLQASLSICYVFSCLTIIPLNVWMFSQKTYLYSLLGIALLVYFVFLMIISWRGYKLLINNFKLHYENLDLIKELSVINENLVSSEKRFHSAFDFAAIGMALVSLDGRWLKVNNSLCQIVGYLEEELLQLDFQTITYEADLEKDISYVNQLLEGKIFTYKMQKRYIKKNGDIVWVLLNVSLLRDQDNKPLYFITQIQDIDAQKNAEDELRLMAYHDNLTGLGNRKKLENSFSTAVAYAKRHQKEIAVMFIDLDHFKDINDNLGHDVGDHVLIEVAVRLNNCVRATDVITRLGGDEFIVLLTEISDYNDVRNVATKILKEIKSVGEIKHHSIHLSGSIGISVYPRDGESLTELLKNADEALYRVKLQNKNNYKFYNRNINMESKEQIDLTY